MDNPPPQKQQRLIPQVQPAPTNRGLPPGNVHLSLGSIRKLLGDHDLQLTRSMGQNFLHDQHHLLRITKEAQLAAGDKVLEIGPGLGPLTTALLESGADITAVEMDERLVRILEERFAGFDRVHLLHADALSWIREQPHQDWTSWKVVSNLPYSVASPILVEFALHRHAPSTIVVTLQSEVIDRLVSPEGSRDYGILTLLIQQRYEARRTFRIPAGSFFPPPNVDSGCVVLNRRKEDLLSEAERPLFTTLVKLAFNQRRKKMSKLLRARYTEEAIEAAFQALGLDPMIRAEQVGLDQFIRLLRRFHPSV
jgi:16S rRNA (adenine1518-N6/adenine1519-N6)-dimethyltransferase